MSTISYSGVVQLCFPMVYSISHGESEKSEKFGDTMLPGMSYNLVMGLSAYRVLVLATIFVATSIAHDVKPTAVYFNRFAISVEEIEWNTVKDTGDVQRLESFQSRYPNGHYSRHVSRLLLRLRPAPAVVD